MELQPFQRRFLKAYQSGQYDLLALSLPRGNGKSTLAAAMLREAFVGEWSKPDDEILLVSGSIDQARAVWRPFRASLDDYPGLRWMDSARDLRVYREDNGSRARIMSSSGRRAMGIVGTSLVIGDEPAAWNPQDGAVLYDALTTALAKPDSPLKVVLIGTLAPAPEGSFWPSLVEAGTDRAARRYVQSIAGDPAKWQSVEELRRANPLVSRFKTEFAKLRQSQREAVSDPRKKAQLLAYHLNCPGDAVLDRLITLEEWRRTSRVESAPARAPIVAFDLGGSLSWSVAVAYWPDENVFDALGIMPGVPSVAEAEARDSAPAGAYQRLIDAGALALSPGRRMPEPKEIVQATERAWGLPERAVADMFRLPVLRDCAPFDIEGRRALWSQATEDILATRRLFADRPPSFTPRGAALIYAALRACVVENDTSGNHRLRKVHKARSRDDGAAALAMACGLAARGGGERVRVFLPDGDTVGVAA